MSLCPVCGCDVVFSNVENIDGYTVNCSRCGTYTISRMALLNIKNMDLSSRQRSNISGYLFSDSSVFLSANLLEDLVHLATPSFHARADRFLEFLEGQTQFAGHYIEFETDWVSAAWCVNQQELMEVVKYLQKVERVKYVSSSLASEIKILPEGWAHLEKMKATNRDSKQCFVAMWFDDSMNSIYDGPISLALVELGFLPHRVDKREHNGKIDEEIITQIRRSRFLLADFTGHRGGVYFEAGFAKGLNIEVIWTCREDHMKDLHFDIRQYNCIGWSEDNLDKFRVDIKNRVEAVIGHHRS
jgi:hypothetical protein